VSLRTQRVARLIQRDVATILQQEYAGVTQNMVTVTGVRITKDLGIAYIDVSVFAQSASEKEAIFQKMVAVSPEVRHSLAAKVRHQLRVVPELRFFLDDSADKQAEMEHLFRKIRDQRTDQDAPDADDEA
jgi:ribosome-binding factor A